MWGARGREEFRLGTVTLASKPGSTLIFHCSTSSSKKKKNK
jgi:hypothetical protein